MAKTLRHNILKRLMQTFRKPPLLSVRDGEKRRIRGYNITINGHFWRYERHWSDANRLTRAWQRKGYDTIFKRADGRNTRRELNQARA